MRLVVPVRAPFEHDTRFDTRRSYDDAAWLSKQVAYADLTLASDEVADPWLFMGPIP